MKVSIGGVVQALLGRRAAVISVKAVDAWIENADDSAIVSWIDAMKQGKPTQGNPLNAKRKDKVITIKIRVSQDEILKAFKGMSKAQTEFHDEWLADREVEEAAELIKDDNPSQLF